MMPKLLIGAGVAAVALVIVTACLVKDKRAN